MYTIDQRRASRMGIPYTGEYFNDINMEEIISAAYGILEELGIRVLDADIRERLGKAGFDIKDKRIRIERNVSRMYLENTVKRCAASEVEQQEEGDPVTFDGWINTYPYYYEHPESSEIIPFDTDTLVRMTRFIENFSLIKGFTPSVPGYPNDIPPQMAALAKYKIWAENCRCGWTAEPASRLSAKYLFEMTEVMGQKMERMPVYVATPLTLGDESFYAVMDSADKLKSAGVYTMPSFGASTPLSISCAYSLALAEVLGSTVLLHELTGLPVDFHPSVFPFDFHELNIVFGSPEKLIFEWMSNEFDLRLYGRKLKLRSANIHTWAKKAGIQAAVEKGTLMMAGALKGARYFEGLGALSLDEVFSPLQLVIDVEIMDHVSRVVDGMEVDKVPEDLNDMIRQGLDKGFVGSDLTLDNHGSFIWYSSLFERNNLQAWRAKGEKDALERARAIVRQTMNEPVRYVLDDYRIRSLDKIYDKALKEAGRNA